MNNYSIVAHDNFGLTSRENDPLEITQDLFESFIEFLDVSPQTLKTYSYSLKQFFTYLSKNEITKPTREDIRKYKDELKTRLSPATVQIYIIAVRLFFNWLEQELGQENVAKNIKGVKLNDEHKRDHLTSEQIKKVLSKIEDFSVLGKRDYAMITLIATCGLRTIEIERANLGDIGQIEGTAVLYIQGKGETEKSKFVKINLHVEKVLNEYLSVKQDQSPDSPLFESCDHKNTSLRLTAKSIGRIVKGRFKKAGIDSSRLTTHSLRHSAATISLLDGQTIQQVQEFMRHKNIETTLVYSHNLNRLNNECNEIIAKSIFDD